MHNNYKGNYQQEACLSSNKIQMRTVLLQFSVRGMSTNVRVQKLRGYEETTLIKLQFAASFQNHAEVSDRKALYFPSPKETEGIRTLSFLNVAEI